MAKALTERSKSSRGTSARADAGPAGSRRQRLWRDLALIVVAPLLLYLLACLVSYSPDDPSGSNSGSITGEVHNLGGLAGAWIADLLIQFFGYAAFIVPVILGAVAWIALFGLGEEDELGPALRLVGIVGFLVSLAGMLHMRLYAGDVGQAGGGIGKLVGQSLANGFGSLGSNMFLIVLALVSVTLATGLSWFWVMEKIGAGVLALTPISAFRPRRWRGALLPHAAKITFEILEEAKRPVSAVADSTEMRDAIRVDVEEARDVSLTLLFDQELNFEERILKEQFTP